MYETPILDWNEMTANAYGGTASIRDTDPLAYLLGNALAYDRYQNPRTSNRDIIEVIPGPDYSQVGDDGLVIDIQTGRAIPARQAKNNDVLVNGDPSVGKSPYDGISDKITSAVAKKLFDQNKVVIYAFLILILLAIFLGARK